MGRNETGRQTMRDSIMGKKLRAAGGEVGGGMG